jgi:hypothetical protein
MKIFITSILTLFLLQTAVAQEHLLGNFDFSLKAGFNIGGTAPMGIPAPIREIKSFNPLISLSLGGEVSYWLNAQWGVSTGVGFENKGMSTVARVKEYALLLKTDEGELQGLFSGEVKTGVHNGYMTIPLSVTYHTDKNINLLLGFYYAYLLTPSFTGSAYNGKFRTGNEGSEYNMEMTEPAAFPDSFSEALNKHDYGISGGIEWYAFKHFFVAGELDWGLRSIFPHSFKGIDMSMYNLYFKASFGYKF